MDISEKLVAERRARLAAERSLEQMKSELYKANENLSLHARSLSSEIASTQEEVLTVRNEAADLKVRYEKAETNLKMRRAPSPLPSAACGIRWKRSAMDLPFLAPTNF